MEAVQPHDLGAGEIGVRIGANWVPIDVYKQFMVELLTPYGQAQNRIKILRSESTGQWNITCLLYTSQAPHTGGPADVPL